MLTALQAGVVSIALPFCALIVLLCVSLLKGLQTDPLFAEGVPDTHASSSHEPDHGVDDPAPIEEPTPEDDGDAPKSSGA